MKSTNPATSNTAMTPVGMVCCSKTAPLVSQRRDYDRGNAPAGSASGWECAVKLTKAERPTLAPDLECRARPESHWQLRVACVTPGPLGRGGENGLERCDLVGDEHGVRVAVVRDAEDSGEDRAFAALPRVVINAKWVAVGGAGVGWKQAPRNDGFDGGVAGAAGSPVDDAGSTARSTPSESNSPRRPPSSLTSIVRVARCHQQREPDEDRGVSFTLIGPDPETVRVSDDRREEVVPHDEAAHRLARTPVAAVALAPGHLVLAVEQHTSTPVLVQCTPEAPDGAETLLLRVRVRRSAG